MPSRWHCLTIILFWAAANGWWYVRELEPNFRNNDPPPYVIELTAETQTIHPRVNWKVFQNDGVEPSYLAHTWMDHSEEDDSFSLHALVRPAPLQSEQTKVALLIQELESTYRVSRDGKLLEIHVDGALSRRPVPGLPDLGFTPRFDMRGRVVQGGMLARLTLPDLKGFVREADSTFQFPVSQNGTIFLPLHPVHKIHGVRPGQSWRVPEIDPLGNAARAWLQKFSVNLPSKGERFLDARVLERPEPFPYDMGDGAEHECWVIDYRDAEDERTTATTRVEVGTDLVLSQEAASEAGTLRLVRDSARSKVR
jgi:hypothetical protein